MSNKEMVKQCLLQLHFKGKVLENIVESLGDLLDNHFYYQGIGIVEGPRPDFIIDNSELYREYDGISSVANVMFFTDPVFDGLVTPDNINVTVQPIGFYIWYRKTDFDEWTKFPKLFKFFL